MRDEKVLILDKEADSGQILKEHINSFGFHKVYLSTNPAILEDFAHPPAFEIIFIDTETIVSHKEGALLKAGPLQSDAFIVVMHQQYDEWAGELMKLFRTDLFITKPFQVKRVGEILDLAKQKK